MRPALDDDTRPEAINRWRIGNEALVYRAEQKLSGLLTARATRSQYISSLITQYVRAQNLLAKLRLKFPEQWERSVRSLNDKEQLLTLEYP
jgi:hypothetical protein